MPQIMRLSHIKLKHLVLTKFLRTMLSYKLGAAETSPGAGHSRRWQCSHLVLIPKNLETEYTWLVVEGTITHLQLFLRIQGQLTTSRSVWTSLAMIEVTLPLLACQVSKVESLLLRQLNRTFTEGRPMQSIRNHPKILSKWNQQHTSQIWPWQRQTKSSEVEALSRRKPGGFCLQIGQKESTYPQGNNSR